MTSWMRPEMSEIMEYKDKFTLDGALKPGPFVSKAKVAKVKSLMEAAIKGDRIANATLAEHISTSDAIFNAAYLINIQALPQFDRLERTWSRIAGVRVLPDFRPAVLRGIFGEFVGLERGGATGSETTGIPANPAGVIPVKPELAPVPYASFGSVESAYGQLANREFAVGWSFEASRNDDAAEFFSNIPSEMIQVALDTEEWCVYDALINGVTAAEQLDAGTTYTGAAVVANSPISRDAISLLIEQMAQRTINGRQVGRSRNGYNIIVPIGAGPAVEFILSQTIVEVTDGSFTLSAQDQGFGAISVVESEYVTGTAWYVTPKPGGLRRPTLELGRLRGNEAPALFVKSDTANPFGSAASSPFLGGFDNSAVDIKVRYPLTGLNWFPALLGWSTGAGA